RDRDLGDDGARDARRVPGRLAAAAEELADQHARDLHARVDGLLAQALGLALLALGLGGRLALAPLLVGQVLASLTLGVLHGLLLHGLELFRLLRGLLLGGDRGLSLRLLLGQHLVRRTGRRARRLVLRQQRRRGDGCGDLVVRRRLHR